MHFGHADEIWARFPELVAGVVFVHGIAADVSVESHIVELTAVAEARLQGGTESQLPEVQAWRRAFSTMGLEPTRHRSASEALLRRLRKERVLPRIHPLVDLCNATSLAFAVPVAAFDVAQVAEYVEVRHAHGFERYLAFSGAEEHPEPGEVIFADAAGRAHARRWTSRQSAHSAVREETKAALIVAEALHDTAADDVPRLIATLVGAVSDVWAAASESGTLSGPSSRLSFHA